MADNKMMNLWVLRVDRHWLLLQVWQEMHKLKIVDDDDEAEKYFHVWIMNTIGIAICSAIQWNHTKLPAGSVEKNEASNNNENEASTRFVYRFRRVLFFL